MSEQDGYDYVIVGSGVAAATIADRIVSKGPNTSILILEAGRDFAMANRRTWWNYVTSGVEPSSYAQDPKHDAENPVPGDVNSRVGEWGFQGSRLMVRGGSTVHWGGWSLRLKPEDFRLQRNTGWGANWPFDYEHLAPYYDEAERLLGVSTDDREVLQRPPAFEYVEAAEPFIRAFEELGLSYGPMPIARYRHCMTTGTCKYCPFGARYAAPFVLDELEKTGKVTIKTEVSASEILMRTKQVAAGVIYEDRDGRKTTAEARRVIVAGGAYESPKILQRSKSGGWLHGVGNDYDLVGRYLVGHRLLRVVGFLPSNNQGWVKSMDFPTLMSRHYDKEEQQRGGKLFMFRDRGTPDTKIAEEMAAGLTRKRLREKLLGPMRMRINGFMEDFGRYENRVENAEGVNAFGLRGTAITFRHQAGFKERAYQRMRLIGEVLQKMGCDSIDSQIVGARGDHASGSCRMGRTPEEGVVDENLRVFGTENAYVCSNAVMPSLGAVNPTLTLTALSIRLADHLLG